MHKFPKWPHKYFQTGKIVCPQNSAPSLQLGAKIVFAQRSNLRLIAPVPPVKIVCHWGHIAPAGHSFTHFDPYLILKHDCKGIKYVPNFVSMCRFLEIRHPLGSPLWVIRCTEFPYFKHRFNLAEINILRPTWLRSVTGSSGSMS